MCVTLKKNTNNTDLTSGHGKVDSNEERGREREKKRNTRDTEMEREARRNQLKN